jgi:hypothetical protein
VPNRLISSPRKGVHLVSILALLGVAAAGLLGAIGVAVMIWKNLR